MATYPESRAGDTYALTIYTDDAPSGRIHATLNAMHERDEDFSPKYRTYRGKQVPVFRKPPGFGLLDKVRGEPRWTAWLQVVPRYMSDLLVLLGQDRQLYVMLHERKEKRVRWVQGMSLQTTDPAEE